MDGVPQLLVPSEWGFGQGVVCAIHLLGFTINEVKVLGNENLSKYWRYTSLQTRCP
ncbi:hypothetical protein P691DRAFT_810686 [Macrolepiota fuliginosa MF-IS2]|uniref:Uncharacterized protein n=1 Tax=Macrolepiota fuliginosa MF-IS2 TaxID=1400762 RepID=A0A9P5X0B3_9AGAR|nr:hypothetical protein P691DRAFT_810686 [Macrolepiota fuliginosa MF-IS2]